jgi:phage shock protein PspC (stress-responsive transcriptional regulator)
LNNYGILSIIDKMDKNKIHFQLVWGVLLVLAGFGVFYRIPQVIPRLKTIESFSAATWFIYICFYLLGFLLIMGGGKKIYENYRKLKGGDGGKN